jgi:hypothetical protein
MKNILIKYLMILLLFIFSCKDIKSVSDEDFCGIWYHNKTKKSMFYPYDFKTELNRRRVTRTDSIVDGIIYKTILRQPECFPVKDRWEDEKGNKIILQTEKSVKEEIRSERMNRDLYTELNGHIAYHYKEDKEGKIVKHDISILNDDKYYESSFVVSYNNDTIYRKKNFVIYFDEMKIFTEYFEIDAYHNNKIIKQSDLIKYKENKNHRYYKYVIQADSLGINETKGKIKVSIKDSDEQVEIPLKFKYVVIPEKK